MWPHFSSLTANTDQEEQERIVPLPCALKIIIYISNLDVVAVYVCG